MLLLAQFVVLSTFKEVATMNGPLQFETVETSKQMLDRLYGKSGMKCTILVPLPDSTEKHPLEIIVTPLRGDDDEVHEIVGGDRSYRTTARFTSSGDSFEVEVVIRYHDHETRPATVFVSQDAERIIAENRY